MAQTLQHDVQVNTRQDLDRNNILSMNYAPDNSRLVVIHNTGNIEIRDVDVQKPSITVTPNKTKATAALFSADSTRIFAACSDGSVHIYSEQGKLIDTAAITPKDALVSIARNGNKLAFGSESGALNLAAWDNHKIQKTKTLPGHTVPVAMLKFDTLNSRYLVSASKDGRPPRLWDTETGLVVITLTAPENSSPVNAFTTFGGYCWTVHDNGSCVQWDIPSGRLYNNYKLKNIDIPATTIALSVDGNQLAIGFSDHLIRIVGRYDQQIINTLEGHSFAVSGLEFRSDGRQLASYSGTNVKFWSYNPPAKLLVKNHSPNKATLLINKNVVTGGGEIPANGEKVFTVAAGKVNVEVKEKTVKVSGVSEFSVNADETTTINLERVPTGSIRVESDAGFKTYIRFNKGKPDDGDEVPANSARVFSSIPAGVISISVTEPTIRIAGQSEITVTDGQTVAIKIYEAGIVRSSSDNVDSVVSIASDSGKSFFAGIYNSGSIIRVWNVNNGKLISELTNFTSIVNTVCGVNGFLVAGATDGTILIFDPVKGICIKTIKQTKPVIKLTAHSSAGLLAVVLKGGELKLYKTASWTECFYEKQNSEINGVAFNHDGTRFTVFTETGVVVTMDINGKMIHHLPIQEFPVKTAVYDFDGYIALGKGKEVAIFRDDYSVSRIPLKKEIKELYASPDGNHFAAVLIDNAIEIYTWGGQFVRSISGCGSQPSFVFLNENRVLTSGSDGSIRVIDVANGSEKAKFVSYSDNEWNCTTSSGFYLSSKNGEAHLFIQESLRTRDFNPSIDRLEFSNEGQIVFALTK
jgi:WD40 repeat protein